MGLVAMTPDTQRNWDKWCDSRIDRFINRYLIDAIGKTIADSRRDHPPSGTVGPSLDGLRAEFQAELQRHEQNFSKLRADQEIDAKRQITKLLDQKNERGEFEARVERMLLAYEAIVLELRREIDQLRRTSR